MKFETLNSIISKSSQSIKILEGNGEDASVSFLYGAIAAVEDDNGLKATIPFKNSLLQSGSPSTDCGLRLLAELLGSTSLWDASSQQFKDDAADNKEHSLSATIALSGSGVISVVSMPVNAAKFTFNAGKVDAITSEDFITAVKATNMKTFKDVGIYDDDIVSAEYLDFDNKFSNASEFDMDQDEYRILNSKYFLKIV